MGTLVVADVHGNADLLRGALAEWGALSDDRGFDVLQVGDLMNVVLDSEEGDLRCLELALMYDVTVLVGNHEQPLLGGGAFSGCHVHPSVREAYTDAIRAGTVVPCAVVHGALVTHAGVVEGLLEEEPTSAENAHDILWETWLGCPTAGTFDMVGSARGGWSPRGGVLWSDLREPKVETFSQLFGHTPHDGPTLHTRENGTWEACIDVGGKYGRVLCAAWLDEGIICPEFRTFSLDDA